MKKINNKGYMLVEIILAFSIAFVLIYFMMDLIVKLKNKNDDLLVETLIRTDQTIITNKLMSYAIEEEKEFKCDLLKDEITDNSVKYKDDMIDIVSKYAKIDVSNVSCSTDLGKVSIKIPIDVEQMKEEDFDVIIDYKYDIGDMIAPECSLYVDKTNVKIVATKYEDNEGGSGILYYGWDESKTGENSNTMEISSVGTYTFYVVDKAKNENSCSVEVKNTTPKNVCPSGYSKASNGMDCVKTTSATKKSDGYCQCMCPDVNGTVCKFYNTNTDTSCSQCPSGYGKSYTPPKYECKVGSINGTLCYQYTNYEKKYECDEENGYVKINDNYCYKRG